MELIAYNGAAIRCYDQVIALNPDVAMVYTNKGYCNAQMGLYERALECFDIALGINPDDITALHNKAAALKQVGRDAEASKIMDRVMERTDGHGPYSVL
jgi:tetratricopeptide (TPR) repeat protein